ncbi:MAG TPA: hypothetical protein PKD58_07635, partial [Candidatus Sumerlaeota bacterium]|nr:hypothetical protein [Candidatus Sumerlaeota bacterium]
LFVAGVQQVASHHAHRDADAVPHNQSHGNGVPFCHTFLFADADRIADTNTPAVTDDDTGFP